MTTHAKFLLITLLASACLFAAGPDASANTLVLGVGNRHSGVGGEFVASSTTLNPVALGYASQTTAPVGSLMGFSTFCLEYNEHFTPGSTYNYSISNAAILGGISGGVGGQDPLSRGTAWLYLNFAQHTLLGYSYTNDAAGNTSAGYLQDTIWWLEGEIGSAPVGNPFVASILMQFTTAATAMLDNNGLFGVAVLNLTDLNGAVAQDQLILQPTVPDGGTTSVLLGLGILSLIVVNRQLHRRRAAVAAV